FQPQGDLVPGCRSQLRVPRRQKPCASENCAVRFLAILYPLPRWLPPPIAIRQMVISFTPKCVELYARGCKLDPRPKGRMPDGQSYSRQAQDFGKRPTQDEALGARGNVTCLEQCPILS